MNIYGVENVYVNCVEKKCVVNMFKNCVENCVQNRNVLKSPLFYVPLLKICSNIKVIKLKTDIISEDNR